VFLVGLNKSWYRRSASTQLSTESICAGCCCCCSCWKCI